jgi:hypothetical protein
VRVHRGAPVNFFCFCAQKNQRGSMDALKNALSIVPSGTAATIIVGHALLTKVMICVETNQ